LTLREFLPGLCVGVSLLVASSEAKLPACRNHRKSSRQSSPTALPSVMQKDRKTALFRRGDGLGSWIQLRSAII
jgi:hypothetical protein